MSSKSRINTATLIRTRAQAIAALHELRTATIQRNILQSKREKKIAAIDDEFVHQIDDCRKDAERLALALEGWAYANPADFEGKRSLDLGHGILGFRVSPPAVKKLRARETFGDIVARMMTLPWAAKYLRHREPELNKGLLITDRETLTAEELKILGVEIVQEDQFFVEPKIDETSPEGSAL